ncbi:hypothetical protein BDL97_15G016000 [Sphagnum fallax]|nr:hypothetical protein BDL97_15G016000 [Sphagnum fallax]
MAGTSGGGFGSKGGDNNEERLRKMVADHLKASKLFAIDTRTPEGLASLTAILGQALQAGLTVGEAQREEEARKAAEAKATEKKRKRDERATTGALSPRTLEKKRRKDERDAIRKEKLDLKKKEEERKKFPLITLAEEGIPTELAYTGAKSTIRHIVSTNFARGVEWRTLSKAEQKRVINQLKEITEQLAKAKKARELGRSDRDLKALELKLAECQSVVDEVGDPPLKFPKATERMKLVPPATHRLGQGDIPGRKTAFASEGESESSQGNSDEEERSANIVPSATTSSGPSSIASRNAGSARGKDKEDREEEEEEEGQGDDDEREEDEQPPPPPENTRKKHSRKKSKRGKKSR